MPANGHHYDVIVIGGGPAGSTAATLTADAHGLCNEIFRRWYDLEHEQARHTFVTVYDTTNNAVREEDLLRLGEKSLVLGYPAQARQLIDVLAA